MDRGNIVFLHVEAVSLIHLVRQYIANPYYFKHKTFYNIILMLRQLYVIVSADLHMRALSASPLPSKKIRDTFSYFLIIRH